MRRFGDAPDGLCERADRRPRRRRGAGRRPPRRAGLGHRLDRHGPRRRAAVAARFGRACSNSAATTPPSWRHRPTSTSPLRAIVFAAIGTAGQRCTTLRRLFVHADIYDRADRAPAPRLRVASTIGDPRERRYAGRPADRSGRLRSHADRRWTKLRAAGGMVHGGERVAGDRRAGGLLRAPGAGAKCRRRPVRCCGRPSRRSST